MGKYIFHFIKVAISNLAEYEKITNAVFLIVLRDIATMSPKFWGAFNVEKCTHN